MTHEEELLVLDLAMMIRRLVRRLERDMKRGVVDPMNRVICDQACGLLARKGLEGNLLRTAPESHKESQQ